MKPSTQQMYTHCKATSCLLAVIIVVTCCAVPASSQPLAKPRTPFTVQDVNLRFPKIVKAPDGRIVMTFIEHRGSRGVIFVALSADDGVSWSEPRRVTDVLFGTIGLQRQPYAVMDTKGVLHLVFEDQRVRSQTDVFYMRSADDGQSWSAAANVSDDPTGRSVQDFSAIAVTDEGTVLISFLDNRFAADPQKHIFIVRSVDNGFTWSLPTQVDSFSQTVPSGACECCVQNIAAGSGGRVAVAFRSNNANKRDVYIAASLDDGQTFLAPMRIASDTWTIDACPATGPTVVFDSAGSVHLAWMDERDAIGAPTIWYGRWAWMSRMIPINTLLMTSDVTVPNWPDLAVSADGSKVGVAWQTLTGVLFARSNDYGSTFDIMPVESNHARQEFAHVVRTNAGTFIVSWQGLRGNVHDVFVTSDVPTGIAGDAVPQEIVEPYYIDILGRRQDPLKRGLYFEVRGSRVQPVIRW